MARTVAMRETARLAMTRLHFSRGLRRAEISRSSTTTLTERPLPGDIVYFYRYQKYPGRLAKRVLALRRWHGPALLVAWEGENNCFVSHKGQLVKCAAEHIRKASSMEQISSGAWEDAIAECIEAALNDRQVQQQARAQPQPQQAVEPQADGHGLASSGPSGDTPGLVSASPAGMDLPPVDPPELIAAAMPRNPTAATSGSLMSSVPSPSVANTPEVDSEMQSAPPGVSSQVISPMPTPRGSMPTPRGLIPRGSMPSMPTPRGLPLRASIERARDVGGMKRPAELEVSAAREQADLDKQFEGGPSAPSLQFAEGGSGPGAQVQESMVASREQLVDWALESGNQHPLLQVQALAAMDRLDPSVTAVEDHGSWDGRWQLPSRSEWKAKEAMCQTWPCGRAEYMKLKQFRQRAKNLSGRR